MLTSNVLSSHRRRRSMKLRRPIWRSITTIGPVGPPRAAPRDGDLPMVCQRLPASGKAKERPAPERREGASNVGLDNRGPQHRYGRRFGEPVSVCRWPHRERRRPERSAKPRTSDGSSAPIAFSTWRSPGHDGDTRDVPPGHGGRRGIRAPVQLLTYRVSPARRPHAARCARARCARRGARRPPPPTRSPYRARRWGGPQWLR